MASEASGPGGGTRSALLVDWGGVLTTNLFASFGAFCTDAGLAPDALVEAFRGDAAFRDVLIAFEEGKLDEVAFEQRFGGLLGVPHEGLIDRLFERVEPDVAMLDAVRAARAAGIRTGLVSNSWGTRRYDRAMLEELFDGVVISGEVGIRKPAPEMYRLGAERAGAAPEACVYVDDLPFNLPPAADLGMATVHHVDTPATIAEVERLLDLTLA
jgi:epoxide hydrolase-like predicted phosphatase